MRNSMMIVAIVIATATLSLDALAAPSARQAQRPTYDQCVQLGFARGYSPSPGDWRNLERFIYQCLAGRVPL